MSLLPIEPDRNRHCFAPCQPGKFCACLGRSVPRPPAIAIVGRTYTSAKDWLRHVYEDPDRHSHDLVIVASENDVRGRRFVRVVCAPGAPQELVALARTRLEIPS